MQPPVFIYRISHFFYKYKLKPVCFLFDYFNRFVFKCWIPGSASIGKNFSVGYWGIGVIIHSNTIIGDDCQVNQNVTIGRKYNAEGAPVIGNHVYIGANSVVYGKITIGDNTVIGALSLINKDIPAGCFAAGIPARIIKQNTPGSHTA